MKMETLILDVTCVIHNLLDFRSQVNLRLVSTHFAQHLHVTNLHDCMRLYMITAGILADYPHATKLNISHRTITDISHMNKLQTLYAVATHGLTNESLKHFPNLVILSVHFNSQITDVNCLKKLQVLHAGYTSGIGDNGLKDLVDLIELHVPDNPRVTNVNHMRKLRVLNAKWNANHMSELRFLDVGRRCGIDDNGLRELTELRVLNVEGNYGVTDVNHMSELRFLDVGRGCGVGDEGVKSLKGSVVIRKYFGH